MQRGAKLRVSLMSIGRSRTNEHERQNSMNTRKEPTPQEVQKGGQGAVSQDNPALALDQSGEADEATGQKVNLRTRELGDQEVAILCDIGAGQPLKPKDNALLAGLVRKGFVRPAQTGGASPTYALTAKAQQLLGERGAGLCEA
jgi:hypothetical protein